MRRPSIYSQRQNGVDVKMTPMIDVVFLLLVFFVWTSSFQIVEQILPSSISAPSAAGTSAENVPPPEDFDFEQIVIRLLWQGDHPAWTINDAPLASLAEVRARLAAIGQIKRDAPVILDPDPAAPLGHVIDLYDAARLENFQRVQFAASEAPR